MLLHVSLSTVRRVNECGLRMREMYSDMTDMELDSMAVCYVLDIVFSKRVRSAMIRMDPEGILSRWRQTVHRRQYSVPSSNSLWHVDGNHRLIRY